MVTGRGTSLSALFAAAQRVPPPSIDVSGRVLDTLHTYQPVVRGDASLWFAATLSVAAAAAVLLLVVVQDATASDPFVQWLSLYVVVAL